MECNAHMMKTNTNWQWQRQRQEHQLEHITRRTTGTRRLVAVARVDSLRTALGDGDALQVRLVHAVVQNAELPAGTLVLRVLAVDIADAHPRRRLVSASAVAVDEVGAGAAVGRRAAREWALAGAERRRESPLGVVDRLVEHHVTRGGGHRRQRHALHVLNLR